MTDDRTPVANIAPFGLRMQPDLKLRVDAAAKQNRRSMNAEIVHRLEESFRPYAQVIDFKTGDPKRTPPMHFVGEYSYQSLSDVEILDLIERYSIEVREAARVLTDRKLQPLEE